MPYFNPFKLGLFLAKASILSRSDAWPKPMLC